MENELFNIPTSFHVGGQMIKVKHVNNLPYDKLGQCSLCTGEIKIAEYVSGGDPQCSSCQVNTFWHEVVHAILDTMHEGELSENEKFVCTFSSFLCEAINSFNFDRNE